VEFPLDLNMILGHDYIYDMNVMVHMLFHVMNFPHNISIVPINKLEFDPPHPCLTLYHVTPLYVPSVLVDTTQL
jgi:hypothetical protein